MSPLRSLRSPSVVARSARLAVLALALLVVTARADDAAPRPVLDTLPNGALQIEPIEQQTVDIETPHTNLPSAAEHEIAVSPEPPATTGVADESQAIAIPRRQAQSEVLPRPWYRSGLVSLVVVLALIIVLTLLARRLIAPAQASGAGVLCVLSRTVLSPKQSIALVQMGRRFAYIGVTSERITTLHVVEDDEEAASLRSALGTSKSRGRVSRFDDVLTGERGQMEAHLEPALPSTMRSAQQVTRTREDLKGLLSTLRSFGRASGESSGTRSRPERERSAGVAPSDD